LKLPTRGERGLPSFKTSLLWSDPVGAQRRRAKDLRCRAPPSSSRPKHGFFPHQSEPECIDQWAKNSLGPSSTRKMKKWQTRRAADSLLIPRNKSQSVDVLVLSLFPLVSPADLRKNNSPNAHLHPYSDFRKPFVVKTLVLFKLEYMKKCPLVFNLSQYCYSTLEASMPVNCRMYCA